MDLIKDIFTFAPPLAWLLLYISIRIYALTAKLGWFFKLRALIIVVPFALMSNIPLVMKVMPPLRGIAYVLVIIFLLNIVWRINKDSNSVNHLKSKRDLISFALEGMVLIAGFLFVSIHFNVGFY